MDEFPHISCKFCNMVEAVPGGFIHENKCPASMLVDFMLDMELKFVRATYKGGVSRDNHTGWKCDLCEAAVSDYASLLPHTQDCLVFRAWDINKHLHAKKGA